MLETITRHASKEAAKGLSEDLIYKDILKQDLLHTNAWNSSDISRMTRI